MTEQEINLRIGNLECELKEVLRRFTEETGVIVDNMYPIDRESVDVDIYYDVGVEVRV